MITDVMTYKKLIEKYPHAKDDIERLRNDKNLGLKLTAGIVLLIGIGCGWSLRMAI